ncbi:type VI secretion system baseplate subunit TssE [bacterium]|nr:type VI secretion system baseplate subunit TssE [bacterium]
MIYHDEEDSQMNKGGFFERIMLDRGDSIDIIQSIQKHLVLLLNTRDGSVSHLSNYGLPDLSVVYNAYPDSIELLRRSIKTTIEKYEPRLRNVRVDLQDADSMVFEATFKISAELQVEGEKGNIQFLSTISNTGKTSVE